MDCEQGNEKGYANRNDYVHQVYGLLKVLSNDHLWNDLWIDRVSPYLHHQNDGYDDPKIFYGVIEIGNENVMESLNASDDGMIGDEANGFLIQMDYGNDEKNDDLNPNT